MKFSLHDRCQWVGCSEIPTRHVTFSVRVFNDIDETHADLLPPDRRDLCDKHTEHVLQHYLNVTIANLDRNGRIPKLRLANVRRQH